ncbi:hypothetical protein JZ751_003448 [Albula glossodonta]|uniref:Uncharacterized protein n=1 Tax=Albula glossodonta TaxID=121402 RepID=A0A8T2N6F2_9TELE|nr:hypothetical protein JZ751_003448 [Albula glossodonta]
MAKSVHAAEACGKWLHQPLLIDDLDYRPSQTPSHRGRPQPYEEAERGSLEGQRSRVTGWPFRNLSGV